MMKLKKMVTKELI